MLLRYVACGTYVGADVRASCLSADVRERMREGRYSLNPLIHTSGDRTRGMPDKARPEKREPL